MMTISVIIPVYNVSAYIERCLQSVMEQTYSDFECILVDDASPDDSIPKCKRMIASYNGSIRFRIMYHSVNRGLSAARNTGTAAAKGDYILYIDSDDAITSDCVEKLMAPVLHDASIDMVIGNAEWVFDGCPCHRTNVLIHGCEDLKGNDTIRNCFYERRCIEKTAWNKLIRKSFLSHYGLAFMEGVIWEDTLWTFFVLKYLSHLYLINDVTYFYTKRLHSITTGTDIKVERYYRGVVFNEISSNFTPNDSNREAKFYLKTFIYYYIDSLVSINIC